MTLSRHRQLAVYWIAVIILATPSISAKAMDPMLGDVRVRSLDGMPMTWVPAGSFMMGSSEAEIDEGMLLCEVFRQHCDRTWLLREQPAHMVRLNAFWIDQREVSNSQFAAFMNAVTSAQHVSAWLDTRSAQCNIELRNGLYLAKPNFEDHPVVEVTWHGALAYAEWVGGRLPTEAEWEYAARGPDSLQFPWGDQFNGDNLNFCDVNCSFDTSNQDYDDGFAKTSPTGSYPAGASWVGALDMAGNVWEWCADWYEDSYETDLPRDNPTGPATGIYRICRGGAWGGDPYDLRSARRGEVRPSQSYSSIGFRCVIDATDTEEAPSGETGS